MTKVKQGFLGEIRKDLPSGLIVFLVAVPLCLGIALASGAPLFSGLIAGMVGGLIVSLLSGSPLGVSGPAAGLAVIVLTSIEELGSFEIFLVAVVVGGLIQLILGFAKAGIIGYYFPSSVIKGMLAGIGVILILKQIPHAFGYDADYEGDFAFQQADGRNTFSELFYMFEAITPGALIIAIVSLAILIIWERPFIKRFKIFQIVQGPLVVVIVGILLNIIFKNIPGLAISSDHLVSIPVAESLSGFFSQFTIPDFANISNPQVWVVGATLAVVASLETLLCVEATDKLDPHKRVTPTNRELKAQGIGNMVSGLIGGLPVTQVIVRSSANIQSGGQTKAAAFFHGIFLFAAVLIIPNFLNLIPLASLAGILLVVGFKLAKPSIFREMRQLGTGQLVPFVVTVLGIVFTDLLIGIGLGMAVAIFYILWANYKAPYFFKHEEYVPGQTIHLELTDNVSFLNKASMLQTLNHLPENSKVIIDGSKNRYIHPDVTEIIEDFKITAEERDIDLEIVGVMSRLDEPMIKKFSKSVIRMENGNSMGPKQPEQPDSQ